MYKYKEEMRSDILNYFACGDGDWLIAKSDDFEEFKNNCYDEFFISDDITGNASGSYTFNNMKAKEYVESNTDELKEALAMFCVEAETVAEHFLNGDYEYFDVTIRCYLLSGILSSMEEELEEIYNKAA